jgi:hypothetical protein
MIFLVAFYVVVFLTLQWLNDLFLMWFNFKFGFFRSVILFIWNKCGGTQQNVVNAD